MHVAHETLALGRDGTLALELAQALVVLLELTVLLCDPLGDWNNVYAPGGGGRVRFMGRFDPTSGVVRGRLMCAGSCPVRGRFRPTCTVSSSLGSECEGPVGPASAGCTASGSIYLKVFEGTWECAPTRGGVLSFGHR